MQHPIVSREQWIAYKRRMGWTFPWASSFGGDFNLDFNVWFTDEQQRDGVVEYNYRRGGHAPSRFRRTTTYGAVLLKSG